MHAEMQIKKTREIEQIVCVLKNNYEHHTLSPAKMYHHISYFRTPLHLVYVLLSFTSYFLIFVFYLHVHQLLV